MKTLLAALAFAFGLCIGLKAEAVTQQFHHDYDLNRPAEAGDWLLVAEISPQPQPPVPFNGAPYLLSGAFLLTAGDRSAREWLFLAGGETGFSLDIFVSLICQDQFLCPSAIVEPGFWLTSSGLSISLRAADIVTPIPSSLFLFLPLLGLLGGLVAYPKKKPPGGGSVGEWHKWFAWFPVSAPGRGDGDIACMTHVWRRRNDAKRFGWEYCQDPETDDEWAARQW